MKVAFIKNNIVMHCYLIGALYKIAKRNFKKDWQAIVACDDEVQKNWIYNPETEEFSAP